jgi:hypothetical protein
MKSGSAYGKARQKARTSARFASGERGVVIWRKAALRCAIGSDLKRWQGQNFPRILFALYPIFFSSRHNVQPFPGCFNLA